MKAKNAPVLVVAMAGLAGGTAVHAAPVTYDYSSGFVTVSAFLGSSDTDLLAAGTQVQLTGGQATFDSTALTLPSFQFLDNTPQTLTIISGAFAGEKVTLSSWSAAPDASYSSSAFANGGSPPTFGFTAGKIDASGVYSLTGPPLSQASKPFTGTTNSLTGQITLGGADMIQLTGITLGVFTLPGNQTITLKGDIVFEGASPVPLPASVWMLASAIAVFGFVFMEHRRSSFSNSWKLLT